MDFIIHFRLTLQNKLRQLYTQSNNNALYKIVLRQKYFRYLNQTNTIVFTIYAINLDKFHFWFDIIVKVSLFGYVIYFTAGTVCLGCEINNIAKQANSSNIAAREMVLNLLVGEDDGEYNGAGFVSISETLAIQNNFVFGTTSFDEVSKEGKFIITRIPNYDDQLECFIASFT